MQIMPAIQILLKAKLEAMQEAKLEAMQEAKQEAMQEAKHKRKQEFPNSPNAYEKPPTQSKFLEHFCQIHQPLTHPYLHPE
jgi:hypothetical protein